MQFSVFCNFLHFEQSIQRLPAPNKCNFSFRRVSVYNYFILLSKFCICLFSSISRFSSSPHALSYRRRRPLLMRNKACLNSYCWVYTRKELMVTRKELKVHWSGSWLLIGPRHTKMARMTWHVISSNLHLKSSAKNGGSNGFSLKGLLLFPVPYHFHHVIWRMKWAMELVLFMCD